MVGIIHYRQFIYLIFLTIMPTAILFLPSLVAEEAKQGFWASMIIATLFGMLTAILILYLDKRFPNKNLIEISEILFGKPGRYVSGLLLAWSLIQTNSIIIREFAEFMNLSILPHTPMWVFIILKLLIANYAVRSGLEVIARISDFVIPLILFSMFILLVFLLSNMEGMNLLPIMGSGLHGILKGSTVPSAWFSEVFLASFLFPYLKQQEKKASSLFFTLLFLSLFLLITFFIVFAVVGVEMSGRLTLPIFTASALGTTLFFEHLDIFFVSIWILGATVKITVFYFLTVIIIGQTFKTKNYKFITIPIGTLLGILSVTLFDNEATLFSFIKETFPYYFIFFSFVLPAIMATASFFRRTI